VPRTPRLASDGSALVAACRPRDRFDATQGKMHTSARAFVLKHRAPRPALDLKQSWHARAQSLLGSGTHRGPHIAVPRTSPPPLPFRRVRSSLPQLVQRRPIAPQSQPGWCQVVPSLALLRPGTETQCGLQKTGLRTIRTVAGLPSIRHPARLPAQGMHVGHYQSLVKDSFRRRRQLGKRCGSLSQVSLPAASCFG